MWFKKDAEVTGMVPNLEADDDPRNLRYEDLMPMAGEVEMPESGDIENYDWTLNQNRTLSCTCHSTVHAINSMTGKKLSARYAYTKIKTDPKYPSSRLDHGAYMVDSLKLMANEGIPDYELAENVSMESDEAYTKLVVTDEMLKSAERNKGGQYIYVTSSADDLEKFDSIRRFLFEQRKPCKVGVTWRSSFNKARKGGVVPAEVPTGSVSGHDMCAVAWSRINGHEYLGFRNSWGATWGDQGRIWLPKGFFKIHAAMSPVPPSFYIPKPEPIEKRDVYLEKSKAKALREAIYDKFPLYVSPSQAEANTKARSLAGQMWLVLVQAVTYRKWTNTDIINFLYARSRNKTTTKAWSLNFNQTK